MAARGLLAKPFAPKAASAKAITAAAGAKRLGLKDSAPPAIQQNEGRQSAGGGKPDQQAAGRCRPARYAGRKIISRRKSRVLQALALRLPSLKMPSPWGDKISSHISSASTSIANYDFRPDRRTSAKKPNRWPTLRWWKIVLIKWQNGLGSRNRHHEICSEAGKQALNSNN